MRFYYVLLKRGDAALPEVLWEGDDRYEMDEAFGRAAADPANRGCYVMTAVRTVSTLVRQIREG